MSVDTQRLDTQRLDSQQLVTQQLDSQSELTIREVAGRQASSDLVPHLIWLGIAILVIGLSFVLNIRNETHVEIPFLGSIVPTLCNFKRLTGFDCPGCGLTRSFVSLAHFRFFDAWRYNPTGFAWFLVVAFQVPYRVRQIARIRNGRSARPLPFQTPILIGLTIAFVVVWFLRFLI